MKHTITILGVLIIILILFFVIWRNCIFVKEPRIIDINIEVLSNQINPANNQQYNARVWLKAYQGELYFYTHNDYSKHTPYDHWLCKLSDKKIIKIKVLGHGNDIRIVGANENFLYYWTLNTQKDGGDILYSYSFFNNEENELYTGKANYLRAATYFDSNKMVSVPLRANNDEKTMYINIADSEVLSISPITAGYNIGGVEYFVDANYGLSTEKIISKTMDGLENDILLGNARFRSIIPVSEGLIIHNAGMNDLLYYINDANDICELFRIECMASVSAVTVWKSNVYISLKRYEKLGNSKLGMVRYENDQEEGTYQVDLRTRKVTKLNNYIFNGLYNLDETCIYACDESANIYIMNQEGSIIDTIISYE